MVTRRSQKRLYIVFYAVVLVFVAVLGRLVHLHVFSQDKYSSIVQRNRQQFQVIQARRGDIVDQQGNVLASTDSRIELGVDPHAVRPEDSIKLSELSELIGIDLDELEEKFSRKFKPNKPLVTPTPIRWAKLAESIDEKTYDAVLALKIKGVYGNRKYERRYPGGELAAHVLGFVNKEGTPSLGVEQYMDFYLKGQDGWLETEKDGRRRELAEHRTREVPATSGNHVELSLDLLVQNAVEKELKRIEQEYKPKSASIIVSDPSTGFILGMGNYPSYDPNEYWSVPMDAHRNRALTDVFEPGSPFKIVASSGALNESLASVDDEFDCSSSKILYQGRVVKLPKDHKPFDKLSFKDVLRKSSNRGVAQLAMRLGDHKLLDYAKAFGYGEKTGFGLPGEVSGVVHDVRNWDGLTIGRMPMGHALNGTAIQMHYSMSVIANGGILMHPQIVKRIYDDNENTLAYYGPRAKRRVLSPAVAAQMTDLLEEVVGPNGTSKRAAIEGFHVAGKSGTTQKIVKGGYSTSHHVASFSGFFPAKDPRVVITVVIDDADIGQVGYGGLVAAPAFKSLGQDLIQYLNIEPTEGGQRMLARSY